MQRSGSTLPDPSAFSRTCLLYGIATLSWLTSQRQSFVRRTVASIQNKETLSTKTRRRDLDAARWRKVVLIKHKCFAIENYICLPPRYFETTHDLCELTKQFTCRLRVRRPSSTRTHRPIEWKSDRSFRASARTLGSGERDNESCFFVRAAGIHRFWMRPFTLTAEQSRIHPTVRARGVASDIMASLHAQRNPLPLAFTRPYLTRCIAVLQTVMLRAACCPGSIQ
ncbi:hypothetical protein EVAR_9701_1 [Eumeta japonica]|uniref:Uncharacterized protein n=1 Tax=Eumeta variegata TaxID=151549 RepID=A0A4C1Y996_EUMVA|nr:hypothetical protein EVAR_9701_1 [Eumeta japonica]